MFILVGCTETRVIYDHWGHFKSQYGDAPPSARDKSKPDFQNHSDGWAILVEEFEGNDKYTKAQSLIRKLTTSGMSELWYKQIGSKAAVYRGKFTNPTELNAQHALMGIQQYEIDGLTPYQDAEMVSLGSSDSAQRNPLDIKYYAGYYTLQVGFYDAQYSENARSGQSYRKAAEHAAMKMRREGERAFFYHGNNRSMVCVGLFTDADFQQDGPVRVYGPNMLAMKRKFPSNLGNGKVILENVRDEKRKRMVQRPQKSSIVRIPS